jgi:broad specificity phosphatase PhoE
VILLARHGRTADNAPPQRIQGSRDPRLDDVGRRQAVELAAAAEPYGIAALWTSRLLRARETAAIVGDALGLEPRVDERLAESHRGSWEGRLIEEVQREEPEAWAAWLRAGAAFRFPGGGESLAEHQERVLSALADVAAGPLPALVICHGGTIRAAIAAAHSDGLDAFNDLDVPNATVIPLPDLAPAR